MDTEQRPIAIQDTYGARFRHCWGCGADNEDGLHIKSYPSKDGNECVCHVTPPGQYTGGVPDKMFGGMIATVFDCHGTASAAWFAHNAKGLKLTEDTVIVRYVTAHLEIDFLKPVPMNTELKVTSSVEEIGERKVIVAMEMEAENIVRAKAKMVAVRVKDDI
ncbi:MAG: thioesterase [Lachnospiraceae bacterium]|nr:thioesterase [Lachnospiraceae bacterium]